MKQQRIRPRKSTPYLTFAIGAVLAAGICIHINNKLTVKSLEALYICEEFMNNYAMLINNTNAHNTEFPPKPKSKPKQ